MYSGGERRYRGSRIISRVYGQFTRPQAIATNLRERGAHSHHGRVVPQEARPHLGLTSIWMPHDRVNGDAIGRDDVVVRDVNVNARECDHPGMYRETQRAVQRGSRDEFGREDDRESASGGRGRGGSRGVAHEEDDVGLVEGGGVCPIP